MAAAVPRELTRKGRLRAEPRRTNLSPAVSLSRRLLLSTDLAVASWERYPENEVSIFNQVSCYRWERTRNKAGQRGVLGMHRERQEAGPHGLPDLAQLGSDVRSRALNSPVLSQPIVPPPWSSLDALKTSQPTWGR